MPKIFDDYILSLLRLIYQISKFLVFFLSIIVGGLILNQNKHIMAM